MENLELMLPQPAGNAAVEILLAELDAGDMAALSEPRNSSPQPLKKIRDKHHRIAFLMASGEADVDISVITGFSSSRLSILKGDPAFKELLSHYQSERRTAETEALKNLASLRNDATSELHERLVDTPESFSNKMLLEILTTTADRTGFGPTTKNMNLTGVVLDAATIAELKSSLSNSGKVVDVSARKASNPAESSVGETFDTTAETILEGDEELSEAGVDVSTEGDEGAAATVDEK